MALMTKTEGKVSFNAMSGEVNIGLTPYSHIGQAIIFLMSNTSRNELIHYKDQLRVFRNALPSFDFNLDHGTWKQKAIEAEDALTSLGINRPPRNKKNKRPLVEIIEEHHNQKNLIMDNKIMRHVRIVNRWNEHLQGLIDSGVELEKLTHLQYLYLTREININYLKQAKLLILNLEKNLSDLHSYQNAVGTIKEIVNLFFKSKKIVAVPYKNIVDEIIKKTAQLDEPGIGNYEEEKIEIEGIISLLLGDFPKFVSEDNL